MNQRDEMARLMLLVENAGKPIVEADYPIPYDSTKPNKEEPDKEEPGKEIAPTAQDTVKKINRRDFLRKARDVAGAALNPDAVAQLAQLAIGSEPTPTPAPAPAQQVQPPIPPVAVRLANVVKKYEYEQADWKALLKIAMKRGDFPASTYDPDEPDIDSAAYQDWWESEGSYMPGGNSDHEDKLDAFTDMANAAKSGPGKTGHKYFSAGEWASVDTAVRDEINGELEDLDAAEGEGSDWGGYDFDARRRALAHLPNSHAERSKKNWERIQAEGPSDAGEANVSYVHIPGVTDPEIIAQNIKNALKPPPGNWWHEWTKWQKEKADEGKVLNLSNVVESILEADYPKPYDSTKPGKEEPGKEVAQTTQPKTMKRRDFLRKARDVAGAALNPDAVAHLAQIATLPDVPTPKPAPAPAKAPYLQHGAWLLRQAYSKVFQFAVDWESDVPIEVMTGEAPEFSDAMDEVDWDFEELVRKVSPEKVKQFLNDLGEVEDELKTYWDPEGYFADFDDFRATYQKAYDPDHAKSSLRPNRKGVGQKRKEDREEDFNENLNHIKKLAGLKQ